MPEIKSITIDEVDNLGLDEHNNLYWLGERIHIKKKIELEGYLNTAIILGGLSTLVVAIIEVLRFFGYGK
ncbi:hypothetical protein LCGC14_0581500 [marine sediment metagenome]|uniref:Uncharacterized protein n=1 Tax=marine sediment metagenome TaxID=412755 RepID=A0A0F9U2G9_9ZZZZ|nr:hypothetical protein [Methylophaga sp.]